MKRSMMKARRGPAGCRLHDDEPGACGSQTTGESTSTASESTPASSSEAASESTAASESSSEATATGSGKVTVYMPQPGRSGRQAGRRFYRKDRH